MIVEFAENVRRRVCGRSILPQEPCNTVPPVGGIRPVIPKDFKLILFICRYISLIRGQGVVLFNYPFRSPWRKLICLLQGSWGMCFRFTALAECLRYCNCLAVGEAATPACFCREDAEGAGILPLLTNCNYYIYRRQSEAKAHTP